MTTMTTISRPTPFPSPTATQSLTTIQLRTTSLLHTANLLPLRRAATRPTRGAQTTSLRTKTKLVLAVPTPSFVLSLTGYPVWWTMRWRVTLNCTNEGWIMKAFWPLRRGKLIYSAEGPMGILEYHITWKRGYKVIPIFNKFGCCWFFYRFKWRKKYHIVKRGW